MRSTADSRGTMEPAIIRVAEDEPQVADLPEAWVGEIGGYKLVRASTVTEEEGPFTQNSFLLSFLEEHFIRSCSQAGVA